MRRARPVVVPNSPPASRSCAPSGSSSSVGNGPGAHAGGVRLGDAPDVVERPGPDAGARRRRAGDRVRRGHERIRAVVDVEQGALSALEHHEPTVVEHAPRDRRRVRDEGLEPVAVRAVLLGHRVQVELRELRVRPQHQPLGLHRRVDLLAQDVLVQQVLHADAEPSCLVGVAGADAAPGGPDLKLAELRLALLVEQLVVRHDQVRVGRDAQAVQVDPAPAQLVDLRAQHHRVHHHAVADRAELAGVEDPRRDQVELEGLALTDDRVTGVVAALKADHEVGLLGEQVHDLSLPFVAPLGADDYHSWHGEIECRPGRR